MHWACCKTTDFSEEDIYCAYRQLSPSRKARIDRLRHREDKKRSLAAELLVYQLLKKYWNITSAKLHSKENGEPYFSDCALYVSISHCDEVVACAVSEKPIGIDIERIQPVSMNLFRIVCTLEELGYLSQNAQIPKGELCRDMEILQRFFEIWTAKEAYFKKCGTGITDLKSVNVLSLQREMHMVGDCIIQIVL